ncbi:MAG: glycosyltransferase family 2 protein [Nitrospirae bacterium]|nr:glycosyltransferase family 2 protein [Nitrospirota bacterium]
MNPFKLIIRYSVKSFKILKNDGVSHLYTKIRNKLYYNLSEKKRYQLWINKNEPKPGEIRNQRNISFLNMPKISLVVPAYNTPKKYLVAMIESVASQSYSNWELCIAYGGNHDLDVNTILERYASNESRIIVKLLNNRGIAGNSNEAIALSTGDYIAFLDHDDTLASFALFELVKAINENPGADLLYSDEDILSDDGTKRMEPQFKPDWSPDLLRSFNYICHLTALSKQLLALIGPFREGFEGSQDHDLFLRASEQSKKIVHISKVLYHWRSHASSVAMNMSAKLYAFDAGKRAVADHLDRIGFDGTVEDGLFLGSYKINFAIHGAPLISIIIPNHNNFVDLQKCVQSVLGKLTYANYEIIIVESNSSDPAVFHYYEQLGTDKRIKVIVWDKPFNYSAVNNYGAGHSSGSMLVFLNNDTEIINTDWLQQMAGHAQRKDVGAVGAKLYYPDDTIQHGGIILGLRGITGHAHRYFPRDSHGYMGRLKVVQNVSAITGACFMTRKVVFEKVGGFDEDYPLAFGDIDYCLKLRGRGYLIVWTPYAELYHYESKTRGSDEEVPEKKLRFFREFELYKNKWQHMPLLDDPYYNPNLTRDSENFSIRI